jgi:glycine cleavage system T protein
MNEMAELTRTPLAPMLEAEGATLGEYHGAIVPVRFADPITEHQAVRRSAGFFDFSFRARLAATGADHVTFLHNMLSNDVKGLVPGQGTHATLLDIKGHILADLRVYRERDQIVLETDADLVSKVMQTLERYIIMDDVTLRPLELFGVALQGPGSSALLGKIVDADVPSLDREYDHAEAKLPDGERVRVVKASSTGEDGYEIWADAGTVPHVWEAVRCASGNFEARPCGTEALETLRIEAGIPRYGAELGEDTLPLEAGLLSALSFTKGCYIGQEVVERTRSRGHVNWMLAGFFVQADAPPPAGEKLFLEGKEMGEITSACISPTLRKTVALGYVRREASDLGTRLASASGTLVEVTRLPFYRAQF